MKIIYNYRTISNHIFFWLLTALAVSLPFFLNFVHVILVLLLINWIIENNWKEKYIKISNHYSSVVFASIFFIFLLWLPASDNLKAGIVDLKEKLPLLLLPIIISTSEPLDNNKVRLLLQFFVGSVVLSTLFSMLVYYGLTPYNVSDVREISVFISHTNLSTLITISVLTNLHWIKSEGGRINKRHVLYLALIVWLIFFLVLLKSLAGVVILAITTFILILILLNTIENQFLKVWLIIVMYAIPFFSIILLLNAYNSFFEEKDKEFNKLETYTVNHRPYFHDTLSYQIENGYRVWINVCSTELEQQWKRRSYIKYNGKDLKGQTMNQTLIRYMTSKGLKKDSIGIWQLTKRDILNIERGLTNHIFEKTWSIYPRLYEIIWEIHNYSHTGESNNKTLVQRFKNAEVAGEYIKNNLWFGIGNADISDVYQKKLNDENNFGKEWQTHNQFLRILMGFGLIGLIVFLLAFVAPPFLENRWVSYYFLMIFLVFMLSFLNADTLESPTGVITFSFFYSLFMWGSQKRLF